MDLQGLIKKDLDCELAKAINNDIMEEHMSSIELITSMKLIKCDLCDFKVPARYFDIANWSCVKCAEKQNGQYLSLDNNPCEDLSNYYGEAYV